MPSLQKVIDAIDMIDKQHLDIRTITMGISLLDCASEDAGRCCEKIYDKICHKAENLVKTGESIEREFGIPIVNKRISVTPMAQVAGSCRTEDYVPFALTMDKAAKACGTSNARIILRHIIPNAIGPIIVQATLAMGSTILIISSLSFMGMGIQPPQPEWGTMLYEGRDLIRTSPYLVIFPGVAIALAVLSLNLLGDGLRDALDPRMKN